MEQNIRMEQNIKQRIEAMRDGGLSQLVIPIVPGQESAVEDWGRIAMAFR
jgi:5,10-methylenetetrahydromethanopterin reductase